MFNRLCKWKAQYPIGLPTRLDEVDKNIWNSLHSPPIQHISRTYNKIVDDLLKKGTIAAEEDMYIMIKMGEDETEVERLKLQGYISEDHIKNAELQHREVQNRSVSFWFCLKFWTNFVSDTVKKTHVK